MKNKTFIIVAVVAAVAVVVAMKIFAPNLAPTSAGENSGDSAASLIREHNVSYGNRLGRVSVVEWFDPACESCREIYPVIKRLISEYQDRAHFVLRYMPYHEGSLYASAALEEARELGKFDEALELLFEKQPEWADHHSPRPELIPSYFAKLGIPADKLDPDTLIKKHGEKVRLDESDGNRVGVRGTPTFFVNGQMLRRFDEESLRAALDGAMGAGQ